MKPDSSAPEQSPVLEAANEFLNRELERLEHERDAMQRDLEQIHQSYAWRMIDGYRRWIMRHRENPVVQLYEKIALWLLDRAVGGEQQDAQKRYQLWQDEHALTTERIESIRAALATFPYRPMISVVLSADGAREESLAAAIESVRAQLYDNWRLCILSDAPVGQPLDAILTRYETLDTRIVRRAAGSGGTATAIDSNDQGHGEFVMLLDQCGQLHAGAFFEVVKRLNRNPLDDLFYWDEDKLDRDGQRTEPFFKPDWSPDLLLSMNYFGECFAVRSSLVEKVGGLRGNFGAAQSYDLALRAVEHTKRIVHIPEVLYHRRDQPTSERDLQSTKALEEALRRRKVQGKVDRPGPGRYAVRYDIRDEPLVSILIPTRDHCELLRQCLASIEACADYKNYEIIVLDNDSSQPETLEYFKEIAGKVQIHRCPGPFNFSAINNFGASKARGEFLLFLNNDTQVIRRDWMRAMIEQAQRPEVGAVGARLLFADERIQHAGVVLGIWGVVGHAFRFQPGITPNHFSLAEVIRDCSAVTAACLMIRRSVFDQVHGFDDRLKVEFNDVDLCLRLRGSGYLIVYTPFAALYHFESSTRRRIHVPSDLALFLERWGTGLRNGDPYYNRNLTLAREDWTIAP